MVTKQLEAVMALLSLSGAARVSGQLPGDQLTASDIGKVRAQHAGFAGERRVYVVTAGLASRAPVYQQGVAAGLDGAEQPGAGIYFHSGSVAQRERNIPGVAAQCNLDL